MKPDSAAIKTTLAELGTRAGLSVSVDRLYESLARSIYEGSEEGQAVRSVLGDEVDLVRVPLRALFPFSFADFRGNEDNSLGERARRILNRAASALAG